MRAQSNVNVPMVWVGFSTRSNTQDAQDMQ